MTQITLKGNPIQIFGELPEVGTQAPQFSLTTKNLSDVTLKDYQGQRVVLNIFPSLDTAVCAMSVRRFNAEASNLTNTVVLCISRDLPFAQSRFCGAEGLEDVITLSEMKDFSFGRDYGLEIKDGPLASLLARAVLILDETGKIMYTELVPEIAQEPDYLAALKALV
ncbi:MAG: thiol peroxidase [Candidatus Cloacimonetes bacterium]|nr:thiol peroxidase [Candidatus Cloacimonadota bacterium]